MLSKHNTGKDTVFMASTVVLIIILLSAFIFGLTHKSSNPLIFGRYSIPYSALLLCFFLAASMLSYLLISPNAAGMRWAKNIYTLCASTIAIFILIELGLRILNPWGIEFFHIMPYHMQGMVDNEQLGYVHPKSVSYKLGSNRVELNSHGLRDDEISFLKQRDEKRILMLGDSVAFGWGIDQGETVSDRVEAILKEETGINWQVINAGVNGYNSKQEAAYFRKEGLRYSPDIIILIFVNNDVDIPLEPNETTWRRYPTLPDSLPEFFNRVRYMSFLYQFTRLNVRIKEIQSTPKASSITQHPRWEYSRKAIVEIHEKCKATDVRFLVAHTSNDPEFIAALNRQGIEVISLSGAWQRTSPDIRHVSHIDLHPSASVHNAFAEDLVDALNARRWLR
jgi:lysophospholipase L1-like esterase